METAILTTIISGLFSIATVLSSVWLKHYLENQQPRLTNSPTEPEKKTVIMVQDAAESGNALEIVAIIVGGFIAGLLSRFSGLWLHSDIVQLVPVIATIATCLWIAVRNRRRRVGILFYELEALGICTAFVSGWSLVVGRFMKGAILASGVLWIACAVVGGLVVLVANRKS